MKSDRSSRLISSRYVNKNKDSNSPTLASSYSEKSLWARSYKNEPFPGELRRRLVGRSFNFESFSDEEEENTTIVVEEEEGEQYEKKKRTLPHFKIINDNGEFIGNRSRIKSEKKFDYSAQRCRSVQSLKLPQVVEQKKEEDYQHQKMQLSKLSQFKDKNEFNLKTGRGESSNSQTDRSRESLELNHFTSAVPERIVENEAEETKSDKLKLQNQKSILTTELEKIIVDQLDQKKRRKEETQIESIIEEQKIEEEIDTLNMLRLSLDKLQSEGQYLNKHRDEQFVGSSRSFTQTNSKSYERKKVKGSTNLHSLNE